MQQLTRTYQAQEVTPLLPQWCLSSGQPATDEQTKQRRLDDGRLVSITMHEHCTILGLGLRPPFHRHGIFSEWEYRSTYLARLSYLLWDPSEQQEPLGWTTHRATGRHRLYGSSTLEYIVSPGPLYGQVRHAVRVQQGESSTITSIQEGTLALGDTYPQGTRIFFVYSSLSSCPHTPTCEEWHAVFSYGLRMVVLSLKQVMLLPQQDLMMRLLQEL